MPLSTWISGSPCTGAMTVEVDCLRKSGHGMVLSANRHSTSLAQRGGVGARWAGTDMWFPQARISSVSSNKADGRQEGRVTGKGIGDRVPTLAPAQARRRGARQRRALAGQAAPRWHPETTFLHFAALKMQKEKYINLSKLVFVPTDSHL